MPAARTLARETLVDPSCVDSVLTVSSPGDTGVPSLASPESTHRPATLFHGSTLTCKSVIGRLQINKFSFSTTEFVVFIASLIIFNQ